MSASREQKMQEKIRQFSAAILELDLEEDLVRADELGPHSFEDERSLFERMRAFHEVLVEFPLETLPASRQKAIREKIQPTVNTLQAFQDFDPVEVGQPNARRDNLAMNLRRTFSEEFEAAAPYINYPLRERAEGKRVQGLLSSLEAANEKSESILEAMRRASAEVGITEFSEFFREEAKDHKRDADRWLRRTVWSAVITIIAAAVVVGGYVDGWLSVADGHWVQVAIGKLVFFSVLYFGIVWSGRNYRSHLHNYVVNKHRANALNTFQAFTSATDDKATRDAVLVRATEAIFSPGVSGYAGDQQESGGSPHLLEIIKDVRSD